MNPASGGGRTIARWRGVADVLHARLPGLEVVKTGAPGAATGLCRDALESGADLVVSVGGDGTNNEVLWGFVDGHGRNRFPNAELGVVSTGTGGDLNRSFGAPSLREQIETLTSTPARSIDYGLATFTEADGTRRVRPFLNEASAGLGGAVVRHAGRLHGTFGARATYLVAAIRAIADHRGAAVELILDEAPALTLDLALAVFANGPYLGGGMWIAPDARVDDGLLDVVYGSGLTRPALARLLAKVFRGTHLASAKVHHTRVRAASIRAKSTAEEVLVEVDGEAAGRLPASFEIVPAGLRIRAALGKAGSAD